MACNTDKLTAANLVESHPLLTQAVTVVVAYSGGIDSQVLLHLLLQAKCTNLLTAELIAVYVNHGLSPHSDAWQQQCQQVCHQLGVDFKAVVIQLFTVKDLGIEAAARQARYQALAEFITPTAILVTGHHADDQAETLLLQLFRGAGVKGLAAMPTLKPFATGQHCRPLLAYTRDAIQHYAEEQQLTWIEDESNATQDFDRNYIRHTLLPVIQQRWPAVTRNLIKSAQHLQAANRLLDAKASADLQAIQTLAGSLQIDLLQQLSTEQQQNVLRYWLQQQGVSLPSTAKLQHILSDVCSSRQDANPCVHWSDMSVRRYQGQLYLIKPHQFDNSIVLHWRQQTRLALPLPSQQLLFQPRSDSIIEITDQVTIRFRQGGERLAPIDRSHSQRLKKLLQEWQVAPWLRDQIPLIYINDQLAIVVGFAVNKAFAEHDLVRCYSIEWLR